MGLFANQLRQSMQQVGLDIPGSGIFAQQPQMLDFIAFPRRPDFDEAVSADVSRYRSYFYEQQNLGLPDLVSELDRTAGLASALMRSALKHIKPNGVEKLDVSRTSEALDLTTARRFEDAVCALKRGGANLLWLGPNYQGVEAALIGLNWHRFILGALLHSELPVLTVDSMTPTSIYRGTLLRRIHVSCDENRRLLVRHLGYTVQIHGQADFGRPGDALPINYALNGAGTGNDPNGNVCNRKYDAVVIEVPEGGLSGLQRRGGENNLDYTLDSEALANLASAKIWAVKP